ncbi:MAG: circularly permuted type 2 ATP-grasp protein [Moraxellaceae bacterium]|nr:circularly permuted type 2 ATP-grasp protein [Moraxellaceae bacterium]
MPDLLAAYPHDPACFDEVRAADGAPHPHWEGFARVLGTFTPAQMQQRQDLVNRLVHENGITYNIYGDANGLNRPWRLGPLPNLIPADEWAGIASGIAQRAAVLDRILADIYGNQSLLKNGLLPPELIFGHNNFLWPCVGIRPAGGRFLHLYAADLARAPDGQWWVMADRTQTPSGMGYALENRQIIARAFPTLYRQLRVQTLNNAVAALQQNLARLAPSDGEPPLTVLLSPGRYNETYFEHVYLARQLGMPLVEGSDLTVRQPCVYLKTLNGLKRVHAILRRLDDDFCDPLELRSDSALGVPGLLEAVRAGTVVMANALGTGVLESPGLLGFLPAICQHFYGEELEIPSVASWWCGETPVMEDALAKLADLVIKPAFPSQNFEPVFGRTLDAAGLAELAARIRRRPQAYVAQERVQLARSPVWSPQDGAFHPHATGMRVYAIATERGYVVMPGGLTRVAGDDAAGVVSMQRGGLSKDTWVCFSDVRRTEVPAVRRLGVSDLLRQDPNLPSRTAENLFWLGRYAERCRNHARLLRSALVRDVEQGSEQGAADGALAMAVASCRHLGLLPDGDDIDVALLAAVCDSDHAGSLASQLRALIGAASQVRGRLSQENWGAIVELQQEADSLDPAQLDPAEALSFLDRLLMSQSSLAGFALDNMTQDAGWRFLMIGRRLERLQFLADITALVLRQPGAASTAALDWLLEMADSTITYRSRYLSSAQLIPVLDLVLLDPGNPHALMFQLHKLMQTLDLLGDMNDYGLADLTAKLESLELAVLESEMAYGSRLQGALFMLASLLHTVAVEGRGLSDQIGLRYFAHIDTVSQTTASA